MKKPDVRWWGRPGHFICSDRCKFRLCTTVNGYMISSVGDMRMDKDDTRPREIGYQRLYETYVFRLTKGTCGCGCWMPNREGSEIEGLPASSDKEATANHMAMVKKYAKIRKGAKKR